MGENTPIVIPAKLSLLFVREAGIHHISCGSRIRVPAANGSCPGYHSIINCTKNLVIKKIANANDSHL